MKNIIIVLLYVAMTTVMGMQMPIKPVDPCRGLYTGNIHYSINYYKIKDLEIFTNSAQLRVGAS